MTHSKAPWYLSSSGRFIRYSHPGFNFPHGPNLADLEVFSGPKQEKEANARLIVAAPELLAALQMVCDSGVSLAEPIERLMLDAIAKSKGES